MSSFDSLFIPIETSFGNAEPFTQPYGKKFLQLDTSPLTITDVPRMTPTNQSNIVTSSVFPRSASEALFDSSTKFRQLPCRTFISVGTCPYRERCVYLHDPRCICREAKTKTRRKNKEDVVVDSLFWPVMPYSLVAGKIDANRQPHVIQPYSVPVPQMDTYRSHDQAVYSMWMHFVDFCLATSESNSNANATVSADASPCYQAPDLPVNAYTDKERLDVFMRLSRELNRTPGRSHNATPQQHMQMSRTSSLDSFQDSRMMTPSSQHGHGSGRRTPANPAANSLLNLYSESNPNAHSGTNSALLPHFPATPPRALSMSQQAAAARRHQFSPCPQGQNHPSQQNYAAQDFYPGAHNKPSNLFVSPSPVSISALASPPSGYERKMSLGSKDIRSEGRAGGNFAFPSTGIFSNQPSLGGGVGDFSQPHFHPYDSCDAQGSSDFGGDEWHGSVSGSRSLMHGSDDHNDFSFSERSCSAADQWGEPVLRPVSPGNHFPQWGNFAPSERWSPPLQQPEWEVPVHFQQQQQQQYRPNDDYFSVSQHSQQQQSSAPLHTPTQQSAAVPKKQLSADAPVFRFEPKMHNASHSISSYASCSAIAKAH